VRVYAQFLCDLAAEHYTITARYSPSKVAVACFYLSRACCKLKRTWTVDLEDYTGYKEAELGDILADMEENIEIKELMRYAVNGFKDGLKGVKLSRSSEHQFDRHLNSRGISDVYSAYQESHTSKKTLM
jgi:hypothetical protein